MRLTLGEIRDHRRRLADWHSPTEMREQAERLMDQLGCEDLFNQAGLEFVREVWVAAEFGVKRRASAVRLIADARPDLALRFDGGEIESYELVEADIVGRRRGLEYKEAASTGKHACGVPIEKWATPEQAYEVIGDTSGGR